MRGRRVTGVVILAALVATVGAAAKGSPPKAGQACPSVGAVAKVPNGGTFKCVKAGGKLKWVAVATSGGGNSGGGNSGGGNSGGGNSGGGSSGGGSSSGGSDASPNIENFQVRVSDYNPATGKAGDLVFDRAGLLPLINQNSVFLEFGHKVGTGGGGQKDLPHFTFYAPLGTQVISPIAGIVVQIDDKSGGQDQSLTIAPSQSSRWAVNLDHIKDLTVQQGATVTPGEVLGTVGIPGGSAAGWGANEMTLFHFTSDQHTDANKLNVCPWEGWDSAKKASAQATITKLMASWESWYGDSTVYDEASQVSPGCDFESEATH